MNQCIIIPLEISDRNERGTPGEAKTHYSVQSAGKEPGREKVLRKTVNEARRRGHKRDVKELNGGPAWKV